ncbi:MAG TPA: radical SAM protein [Isosphaeraceae bacterium]|nr:radical SAM protein [Isosphaeraceae bacterium]
MEWIENKSILTPTSGFLGRGYTHSLNAYSGCAFAGTTCGLFCYAQHNHWITEGRPWGFYGAKKNTITCYRAEYDRIKRPRRGEPKPLKIYMSSSTDPYVPQEKQLGLTRSLLDEMVERPPDVLVVQTHTTLIERDLDVIQSVAQRCQVWVSITVETDRDELPAGFARPASLPSQRLETLKRFRGRGISTQATVSPLMPLANPEAFAVRLDQVCDRVILDHFLIGDGSKNGLRTKRTGFIDLLDAAGFGEWARLEKLWEIRNVMTAILGEARVLVSCEGFNAV